MRKRPTIKLRSKGFTLRVPLGNGPVMPVDGGPNIEERARPGRTALTTVSGQKLITLAVPAFWDGLADGTRENVKPDVMEVVDLATELPEKFNSVIWVRQGKDTLAMGNITGAMVFQSTIPVGIGLLFTDWDLSANAAVSVALGLAGGLLAYEALHRRGRFEWPATIAWFALYAAFILVVVVR